MNYFDNITKENVLQQNFAFLILEEEDHVLTITLDREDKKNALHPQMVNELAYAMQYAHTSNEIWILVIEAKGNVFCAGADLKAFMGMAAEHDSTIPKPNTDILLGLLFSGVHKPTIAKVSGDVFAGGFIILASCNIVIMQEDLKLRLPEVKRGLFPFQVMECLMQVMPQRKVIDWCIRGYDLSANEAQHYGLVTELVKADEIDSKVEQVISELKSNSPTAIKYGLEALEHLQNTGDNHKYLMGMLMKTISSKDGQEGLKAFREKRSPVWVGE